MRKATPFVLARIAAFQQTMQNLGLQLVVLQKPENVFYFSNFNPVLNSHPAFVLLFADKAPILLVHAIRNPHAREEGSLEQVECYGAWGGVKALASTPVEAIQNLASSDLSSIGLEFSSINFALVQKLQHAFGAAKLSDVSNAIDMQKIIKDEYEISCIRRSAKLVDVGVETTIEYLKRGYSEAAASTEGQYAMRQTWHREFPNSEVCGFGTSEGGMIDSLHVWCLSNEHIAYGCDCPRHYVPKPGDVTLPMAWAKTDGYHAENERTIIIQSLQGVREKGYQAMLAAREAIFAALKPGVSFESLYFKAIEAFTAYGFGDILPGRVGHGVGCSAHEFPSITKGNQMPLAPNMALTVEPGLMDSSWGGARHSDTILVTENGFEFLTVLPNQRIVLS